MTPAAAFFDLDNTLLRGTSLIQLGRGLHARGFLSSRTLMRAALMEARYRATGSEHLGDAEEARDTALGLIRGRDVEEFHDHCVAIFNTRIVQRFCDDVVALAQKHLTAGHAVWVITASPVEIAELCATHLGLSGGLGTVAERADGRYTGHLVDGLMHGSAKATAVQQLADTHSYDLTRAYAYSDSVNDLPMLELVGHPTAVNPDTKLRQHAEHNNWPLLQFHDTGKVRGHVVRGLKAGTALRQAARTIARRG